MFEKIREILMSYDPIIQWVEFDKLSEDATLPALCIRELSGRVDENMCNKMRNSQISILCKCDIRNDDNRKFFQGLVLFLNGYIDKDISITQLSSLTSIDDDEKNNHYYEFAFNCKASNSLDL